MVKSEKFCENPERKITKLTCCNAKKNHQDKKMTLDEFIQSVETEDENLFL